MQRICKKCGQILENDYAKFCFNCGAKQEPIIAAESTPEQIIDDDEEQESTEVISAVESYSAPNIIDEDEDIEASEQTFDPTTLFSETETPIIDEDEDVEVVEEVDTTVNTLAVDIQENQKPKGFRLPIPAKEESKQETNGSFLDSVTNDPYYNDILPDINEEQRFIPKDIIFKFAIALIGTIAVAIFIVFF